MEPPSAARDEDEVDVVVVVVVVGEKADDDAARGSRIPFVPRILRLRHEQVITRPAGPPRPPIPAKACTLPVSEVVQASLKVEISNISKAYFSSSIVNRMCYSKNVVLRKSRADLIEKCRFSIIFHSPKKPKPKRDIRSSPCERT